MSNFTLAQVSCEDEKKANEEAKSEDLPKVDEDPGKSRDGSKTDDEVVEREEEAIKLDGLSVAQMKELRDKSEKHEFQAEVNRMMKLIINSLYKNKEVGLFVVIFQRPPFLELYNTLGKVTVVTIMVNLEDDDVHHISLLKNNGSVDVRKDPDVIGECEHTQKVIICQAASFPM